MMTLNNSSVLTLDGGINFRSLAGLKGIDDRKIKENCLFRSGALYQISDADCHTLSVIPISIILDYRDSNETQTKPDRVWDNAIYQHVPANPLSGEENGDLEKLTGHQLDEVNGRDFMMKLYQRLPFNNQAYKQLAIHIRSMPNGAILQHCTFGKDRTGVGVALVLFALGAHEDTVMEDYLLTNRLLVSYRDQVINQYANILSDRALTQFSAMLEANPDFMLSALDAIKQRYGTIELWLAEEFQLNTDECAKIRHHYLLS